ncbi:uracil phosphoribosyltransferase [Veillonellaceae bacterium DNF00626]|nr:uracil phosphoribosyltransferase [Veillonellaceae bacterium DNF00626]
MDIHVINHPLIQHKLTLMRKKETSSNDFRKLLKEITLLMGYEITRDLAMEDIEIETPLEKMVGKRVAGKKVGIVPILRAGFGMVEGLTELMPSARIGVIGLYRDPVTAKPVEYYCKLPGVEGRSFILIDPMLATGGSAIAAIDMMKAKGAKNIKFMCLVAAPEGVAEVNKHHPDVPIYTAALDRQLNEKKYILPGLGDAGDRIFGTK